MKTERTCIDTEKKNIWQSSCVNAINRNRISESGSLEITHEEATLFSKPQPFNSIAKL